MVTAPMMSKLTHIATKTSQVLNANAPAILTAFGVSGTVTTAYLTGKASYNAAKRLSEEPADLSGREKVELVWDLYVPAGISAIVTVGCIVGASRISAKRAAAAYSLVTLSERAFEEYREKIVEKLGENKEKAARDEIAQTKVTSNPAGTVLAIGSGNVLCCELYTMRYFESSMESMRKAENNINAKLNHHMYATLDDFYDMVGLVQTSESGTIGWESDRLMELRFTTTLTPDGKPCLAFGFNYIRPL
jgi:Family of unknown function (DUF6353)